MNRCPRQRAPLGWAVALLLLIGLPVGMPSVQAGENIAGGTEGFRGLLGTFLESPYNGRALERIDQVRDDPAHTLVIVMGDPAGLEDIAGQFGGGPHGLQEFLQRGGALLVATNQKTPNVFDQAFDISVTGYFVETDENDPTWTYKHGQPGAKDWPFVDVAGPDTPGRRDPPGFAAAYSAEPGLFKGRTRIATNHPSCLGFHVRKDGHYALPVLATLPPVSRIPALFGWQEIARLPFAMGGQRGEGRVLILADDGLFLNGMMQLDKEQPDTDNFAFAAHCLQWLIGPPGMGRTRILYLENGKVRTDLDFGDKPKKRKRLWEDIDNINMLLAQVEKHNFLDDYVGDKVPRWIVPFALSILVCLALVIYGVRRLAAARLQIDPGTPLLTNALARLAPAGNGVAQRTQSILREKNLYEAARTVAQQFFTLLPGGAPADRPPEIHTRSGTAAPRALGRLVEYLWRLAYGREPLRVTPAQFANLLAQLRGLRAVLAAGEMTLVCQEPIRRVAGTLRVP